MDLSNLLTTDFLVSAGGAVLVLVVAVFIFRKSPGKKTADTKRTEKKQVVAEDSPQKTGKPRWSIKRDFLSKIRSEKKKDTLKDELNDKHVAEINIPVEEEKPVETVDTSLLPDLLEESSKETVKEEESGNEDTSTLAGHEVKEPVAQIDEKTNAIEEKKTVEIANTEPEKTEVIVAKTEEPKKEDETKKPAGGDIFSMFTDEDEEESEASKFAESLDPVNVEDLLSTVRDIKQYMRKQ